MKKFISLICIMAIATGCSFPTYQMKSGCDSPDNVYKSITTVLIKNEYSIVHSDKDAGYIKAEKDGDWHHSFWEIQIEDDNAISGYAYAIIGGDRHYFSTNDDKTYATKWFWNVYDDLASLCGERPIFIEKK